MCAENGATAQLLNEQPSFRHCLWLHRNFLLWPTLQARAIMRPNCESWSSTDAERLMPSLKKSERADAVECWRLLTIRNELRN